MALGPATLVVALIIGVLLVIGGVLVAGGCGTTRSGCPQCGAVNSGRARFCARCGRKLS